MTIAPSFNVIDIADEAFLVKQGTHGADMTKIISLNPTAQTLFDNFKDKEFSARDVSCLLIDKYGIDSEKAETDAAYWIKTLREYGMVAD